MYTHVDPATTFWQAIGMAGWRPYSQSVYNSLWYQLVCHANYIPWKYMWNLDTWRPDVGYWRTVWHRCNP